MSIDIKVFNVDVKVLREQRDWILKYRPLLPQAKNELDGLLNLIEDMLATAQEPK